MPPTPDRLHSLPSMLDVPSWSALVPLPPVSSTG